MRNTLLTLLVLAYLPISATTSAAPLNALVLGDGQAQLMAATSQDRFGKQVAADGDTVAIVASDFQEAGSQIRGAGFVSRRGPDGWSPLVKLVLGNPATPAHFAQSVALSDDTLVFGSFNRNGLGPLVGRADVFVRSVNTWVHEVSLAPANATGSFGVSVALQGDDLLVGDEQADLVTIYRRIGGIWTEVQQLAPPSSVPGSRYGEAVAIDGNLIAVGRPYFPSFQTRKGQLLLYRRVSVGAPFVHEHSYTMSGGGDSPELGSSISGIAVDGNRVLVGAPRYEHHFDDSLMARGAVVALEHDGSNWVAQLLVPSELNGTYGFGMSVAMQGGRALIGASGSAGVYAFVRGAAQWVESQRWSDSAPASFFGRSIAIGDDYAIVGAPADLAEAGIAHVHAIADAQVPDVAMTLSPASVPGCGTWPSVVTTSWSSEGLYCRAVSQGSPRNSSWTDASCPLAPTACLAPLDFRILPALGSTQAITAAPMFSSTSLDGALAIECTDGSGRAARATAMMTVRQASAGECPTPAHTVSASLSQPPAALPNGSFEMRADVTNPLSQNLYAIARHGAHGSVNARIDGTQLVLTYAPDYAAVGTQTQVSDNIGADVSNGSHAVRPGFNITVPLAVFAHGFE